jgi:RimJ/RimL family protein N-acetyltransferase
MNSPDTKDAVVRPAATEDFEAWFSLFEAVAAEGRWLGAELPMDREARRAFFDGAVAGEASAVFVVDAPDAAGLVGMLSVGIAYGGVAELGMAVASGVRSRGVGSALMEAAIGWARERGAHKVYLEVWPHNHAARSLYAKFGFVSEGRKHRHWKRRNGDLWDSVVMGLTLDATTPGGPDSHDWFHRPDPIPFPETGLAGPDGLTLRPWSGSDVAVLVEAMSDDPDVAAWLGAGGEADNAEVAAAWTAGGRQAAVDGTGLRLALLHDGRLAGCLNLHVDPHDPAAGAIGCLVFAGYRDRGLATTAARTMTEWAFGPGGMRRMELITAVDNRAARRAAERAGFALEGVRRAWRVVDGEACDFASYARIAPH